MADAFEFAGSLPFGSAVFVPARPISRDEIPPDLRSALTDEQKLELFDRAANRFSGEDRGIVELTRGVLLADLRRAADGIAHVEAVISEYGHHAGVAARGAGVEGYLRVARAAAPYS